MTQTINQKNNGFYNTNSKQRVHIIGGGTIAPVRTHLALTAEAYGTTARQLQEICDNYSDQYDVNMHLTKMANMGKGNLRTNDDISQLVNGLVEDDLTKIIFFNPALVDYNGSVLDSNGDRTVSGRYAERLKTREDDSVYMHLTPSQKIISDIRKERKDIFVVGFKTTSGASEDEQYIAGLNLLKGSSVNLVLANDVKERRNMIITPEEARYHITTDRLEALTNLVDMAYHRSQLNFTRSTVLDGSPVDWNSDLVSPSLRDVVNYCIDNGAYKPFRGKTVGHFASKIGDNHFLSSKRKSNFNNLKTEGLVEVIAQDDDTVLAFGAKPSVGGQSQRIIFREHPEYDSIVHFHCPMKEGSKVPVREQRPYECGSHECGQNTSDGLKQFGNLSAVYLDEHGPNIVFNSKINPNEVIKFIDENFDLSAKTGGNVPL